eukprot:4976210-Lingulodinium_polyedra.AAC.1
MAGAEVGDVSVAWEAQEFSLTLPCSKTDPRAVGRVRTHGCLCGHAGTGPPDPICPLHTGIRQL